MWCRDPDCGEPRQIVVVVDDVHRAPGLLQALAGAAEAGEEDDVDAGVERPPSDRSTGAATVAHAAWPAGHRVVEIVMGLVLPTCRPLRLDLWKPNQWTCPCNRYVLIERT